MEEDLDHQVEAAAAQIRQEVLERVDALPEQAREELFGRREVGPTLVVSSAEHSPAFRGLNGSDEMRVLKQRLDAAAAEVERDPSAAADRYAAVVRKLRGQVARGGPAGT